MSIAEKFATMEYGPAPEDPKEAMIWLDRHERVFGHFINGAWQKPSAGGYFDTSDPSTGEKLASIAQGSAADVDAAVTAARAASPEMAGAHSACASALSVCHRASDSKTFAATRGARDDGQWQADSREP